MKSGGKGGANTVSGAVFEQQTDLKKLIENLPNYKVEDTIYKNVCEVSRDGELIGLLMQKNALYNYLQSLGQNYKKILSKRLLPDECFYNIKTKTLYIAEKKYQGGAGSVDEKLQTCDFKLKQYKRLIENVENINNVEYFYVLSDFFTDSKYKDVLQYINDVGCHYFYNEFPLHFIGINESVTQ